MSQKFHLYTCILRIHWLDTEFLGTDDLNLILFLVILVDVFLLEVCCSLLFVYDFIFVFTKLTLDNFFYQVNGYVHIVAYLFGSDNISFYRDCNLNFLSFFLNT